jgi:hypothetical protein
MRVCLVYHQRLGDIVRILPIARHLAGQGHEVFIECLPQYHGIFGAVSYVKPSLPEQRERQNFDRIYELEIWPNRYEDFRRSGKTWGDYVFGIHPEFAGVHRKPEFDLIEENGRLEDYGLTSEVCIFAPFGYSQMRHFRFSDLLKECRRLASRRIVILADNAQTKALLDAGVASRDILRARSQADLPRLLRDAAEVFAINSAPCVIAGAVRDWFWHVPSGCAQDDHLTPASRVVTIGA